MIRLPKAFWEIIPGHPAYGILGNNSVAYGLLGNNSGLPTAFWEIGNNSVAYGVLGNNSVAYGILGNKWSPGGGSRPLPSPSRRHFGK